MHKPTCVLLITTNVMYQKSKIAAIQSLRVGPTKTERVFPATVIYNPRSFHKNVLHNSVHGQTNK